MLYLLSDHMMSPAMLLIQFHKPLATLALLASTLVLGATAVKAEEKGTFTSIVVGNYDYVSVNQGDLAVTGGNIKGSQTIIASNGGPFTMNSNFVITCSVSSQKTADSFELEAPCNAVEVTDGSRDELYVTYQRSEGNVSTGNQAKGQMRILGGTGKYEDVNGTCNYNTEYISDDMLTAVSECAWKRSS